MNAQAVNSKEEILNSDSIRLAELTVKQAFSTQKTACYTFHNIKFVENFVAQVRAIASRESLDDKTNELVILAAWFAYCGYAQGHPAVLEKSITSAKAFMSSIGTPPEDSETILELIQFHHEAKSPGTVAQIILSDALLCIFSKKKFLKKGSQALRAEIEAVRSKRFLDAEWIQYLQGLLSASRFGTQYAKTKYSGRLVQTIAGLSPNMNTTSKTIERGVDTLFKTQLRYHSNLVGLADRKAHMLIGMNSISISVMFSAIGKMSNHDSVFLMPMGLLMLANIVTVIFGILVIAPSVPKVAKVHQDDVLQHQGALMSQVIFSDIEYHHFKMGIHQMMKDEDYLYDTLIRGMYETGRVLNKKFQYLKVAYRVFMVGAAVSTLFFLFTLLTKLKS